MNDTLSQQGQTFTFDVLVLQCEIKKGFKPANVPIDGMWDFALVQQVLLEALDVISRNVLQKPIALGCDVGVKGGFVFVDAGVFEGQAQFFEQLVSHFPEKRAGRLHVGGFGLCWFA